MRAVYRALVAPLATAMCHWCVRGWTFELGTSMWWTLTQTTLYHWFRGRSVTKLCATMHLCKQLASRTWRGDHGLLTRTEHRLCPSHRFPRQMIPGG
jgi:hypothetical protein